MVLRIPNTTPFRTGAKKPYFGFLRYFLFLVVLLIPNTMQLNTEMVDVFGSSAEFSCEEFLGRLPVGGTIRQRKLFAGNRYRMSRYVGIAKWSGKGTDWPTHHASRHQLRNDLLTPMKC